MVAVLRLAYQTMTWQEGVVRLAYQAIGLVGPRVTKLAASVFVSYNVVIR